ncbi:MAG: carboxypeptidase-like regulatory domain-containing protein [Tannerella sp.]|jgi:hypothetical protein|nr:carboxypeptidase-like regulatory domain-containing protein [Tannerella sp.]
MQIKRVKSFILACIAVSALTGCVQVKDDPTFLLSGSVTDSETGGSIAGVAVKLVSNGSGQAYEKITDSGGHYLFEDLPGGSFNISFIKEDYSDGGSTAITVGENTTTFDKALTFTKALDLRGKVTDSETGSAVNGVTVRIRDGSGETTTNASGEYTFAGLRRGEYTLVFDKPVYALTEKSVTVTADNTANRLDVALAPAVTRLTGKVTNASTGAAVSGAVVRLSPAGTPASTTTNSSGEYTFTNLRQSAYTITCTAANYYDKTASVTVVNRDESNTYNLELSPSSSTARITINYPLTIDNGAAFYLSFTNTSAYYVRFYYKSNLPSSDDVIKADLLGGNPFNPNNSNIVYNSTPFNTNTNYVFCAIALDGSLVPGQLLKYEFSTKSQTGAYPLARITAGQIGSSRCYYSTAMNTYCKGYSLAQMKRTSKGDISDIELAMDSYNDRNNAIYWETINHTMGNYYYSNVPNSIYVIYSLGFSSSTTGGGTTGLLSRVWYSTSTNSVLNSTPLLSVPSNEDTEIKVSVKSSKRSSEIPLMLKETNSLQNE